jgi:hypothetical protein
VRLSSVVVERGGVCRDYPAHSVLEHFSVSGGVCRDYPTPSVLEYHKSLCFRRCVS